MKTKLFLILASMSLIFTACGERTREELDEEILEYHNENNMSIVNREDFYSEKNATYFTEYYIEKYNSKDYDVKFVGGYEYDLETHQVGFTEFDGKAEDIKKMYEDDAKNNEISYKWCFVDDKFDVYNFGDENYIEDLCDYLGGELIEY